MSRLLLAVCLSHVSGSLSAALFPSGTFTPEPEALPGNGSYHEYTACQEFRADSTTGSGWLLADCIDVWRPWADSLAEGTASDKEDQSYFLATSDRLRQQGTPCYVSSPISTDGAGSTSMRHVASMAYADEMGCDYLFPEWYRPGTDGVPYCHSVKYIKGGVKSLEGEGVHCAAVDWIKFFGFYNHMSALPNDEEQSSIINVRRTSSLQEATESFLKQGGFDDPPWLHWILAPGNKASLFFNSLSSWNASKLERIRELLRALRIGFRRRPRPRRDPDDKCNFSPSRTNIAIHVRLGDRDGDQGLTTSAQDAATKHARYYDMLEEFMATVSAAVIREGEALPVFHIFSETSEPCPSKDTGAFEEFLRWPVETEQIDQCVECPEDSQGAPTCNPVRSGVYRVQGKDLRLHVGLDVENDMSCMIEADGLLMGCSTFGHVAGIFSEGVKFFSVGCEGWLTGPHYKMIPPMAIAERGDMWVPVSGSWRDPAITSENILGAALSQLFDKKRRAR